MAENICSVCGKKFEDEYFDKEQNKCILHCEKEKFSDIEENYESLKKYGDMAEKFSDYIKQIIIDHKNSADAKKGYFLVLKDIIYPLHQFSNFENVNVHFENCKFLNDIVLSSLSCEFIQFFECDFLSNFITQGKLGEYNQELIMRSCNFYDNVNISNTDYIKIVDIRETKFYGELNFYNTTFENNVFFNNCEFYKELNLENFFYYKEISFLGIKTIIGVKNRETARLIKNSFEQQNNIIEANKYYAIEMKKYDKELTWEDNLKEKLVLKFHKYSSEHSQNWILSLFWILLFSMGYGLYQNMFLDKNPSSLYPFVSSLIGYLLVFISFPLFLDNILENEEIKRYALTLILFLSGIYLLITHDLTLELPAKIINPVGIKDIDNLNGISLIIKAIIAYLIYQFIISIRQNTRRK